MAARCLVTGYQDEYVDRQVTPNVIHQTAKYTVWDDATGVGTVGMAPVLLAASLTPAQMATAIKTAVIAHIRDVATFSVVPTMAQTSIPTIAV